ncbi:MAG: alpha/beta fold hydrolase [Actinomycetota bacterium]|nr:alpha/beta fold hydrolase [Actinomycetota bacterium]
MVWRDHKAELWRYRNDEIRYRPPVVIVHSLVSRSYVLDLFPGNSAVAFLLRSGLDVFLLDWGVADEADSGNTLEHYADHAIPAAIAAACEAAGTEEVTLLGYCFGGVLGLISAARNPELPIRNLVLMATPVDFTGLETITALVRTGAWTRGRHGADGQRPARRRRERVPAAQADRRGLAVRDALGEPVERRVHGGLPGDGPVGERPRAVPRGRVPSVTLPGIAGWIADHSAEV